MWRVETPSFDGSDLIMTRRRRKLAAQAARRPQHPTPGTVVAILAALGGVVLLGAFGVALAGVLILISPIAVPILLFVSWMRRRRFLVRHAGEALLVVSRRRGWRDFLVNNVAPALPPRTRCVWIDSEDPRSDAMTFIRWLMTRRAGLRRPYLIVIRDGPPRMHFVPLHEALLALKGRAKLNEETRQQVAATIEAETRRALR